MIDSVATSTLVTQNSDVDDNGVSCLQPCSNAEYHSLVTCLSRERRADERSVDGESLLLGGKEWVDSRS